MGIKKALYFVLISASFFFFSCFSVPDPGCDSGNCVPKMSAEEQAEFFKTFIAVGDSISYGCQGLNMEENRQFYSFTAQIARSMNTEFNQPLVEFPGVGIPNPEDAFKNGWLDSYCQSFNSLVKTLVNWKRVDNFENQDSLNCFAATGATLDQMLSYDPNKVFQSGSSVIQDMVGLVSPFIMASIGGRDIRNHKSLIDQALDRNPSFLSVWIGNNDTMYATVLGDPGASTSVDFFQENWNILVDKIKATSSIKGIAVINLPDNTCVPLLQPVDNPFNSIKPGADIPSGSMVPFFVTSTRHVSQVLTPDEIRQIRNRTIAFNAIIKKSCDENNWLLIDCFSMFNDLKANGARLHEADGSESGVVLTFDFASGGMFSLDGIHPSSAGYAYIANVGIKKINEFYGSSLPLVDEMEVWRNDSLCQDPVDPRLAGPEVMENLSFMYNSVFAGIGALLD